MFRFTIRDVLWVIVVIGMGLGWWVDHRRLDSENRQHRGELLEAGLRLIPLESFTQGTERISAIHETAKSSPPSPEAAAEIIHHVRYDPDWRIRVRAMAVLPLLRERAEATEVLLSALHERDAERSADGVVPLYAVKYLADMNVTAAVEDIRSWLEFLKQSSPYDNEMTSILINGTERHLAKLTAEGGPKDSN